MAINIILLILAVNFSAYANLKVLVFSGMNSGFYHESIPEGIAAIKGIGIKRGWAVDDTLGAAAFTDKEGKNLLDQNPGHFKVMSIFNPFSIF